MINQTNGSDRPNRLYDYKSQETTLDTIFRLTDSEVDANYKDFKFTYDLFAEPCINQAGTSSCVLYSHVGAISKILHNCLTHYSLVALTEYIGTWNSGYSLWKMNKSFLQEGKLLTTKDYNSKVLNNTLMVDNFYGGYDKFGNKPTLSEEKYFEYASDIKKDIQVKYQAFQQNQPNELISYLKETIDKDGLAVLSFTYPNYHKDLGIPSNNYYGCASSFNLKYKNPTGNFWCVPNGKTNEWKNYWSNTFKNEYGWHDVIVFGYSDEKKVFAIKNSWSPDSTNGNFYVSYEYLMVLLENVVDKAGKPNYLEVSQILPSESFKIDKNTYNDFIQLQNPVKNAKSLVVSGNGYDWWYNNYTTNSPVALGAGIWSCFGNILTAGQQSIFHPFALEFKFKLSEYSGESGTVNLLRESSFTIAINNEYRTTDIPILTISRNSGSADVKLYSSIDNA
jgi:hypothetical protein